MRKKIKKLLLPLKKIIKPYYDKYYRTPFLTPSRYHIVVFNHNRIGIFVNTLHKMLNLDKNRDKIIIVDNSDKQTKEFIICCIEQNSDFRHNINLFYSKRRNYGWNSSGMLEYFVNLEKIQDEQLPKLVLFMQEHYLEPDFYKNGSQKSDTVPIGKKLDLDQVEKQFDGDPDIGCLFLLCNGAQTTEYGIPNFPGSCYFTRPIIYKRYYHFNRYPRPDMQCYHFAGWLEREFSRILYAYNYQFFDLAKNIKFKNIYELNYKPIEALGLEVSRHRKFSTYLFNLISGNRTKKLRFS